MKVVTAKLDTHKAIKVKREKKKMNMNRILIKFHKKVMHQSTPAAPSPPRLPPPRRAGHLPAFSVPGVRHLQNLRCPGAGRLPTPGLFPSF